MKLLNMKTTALIIITAFIASNGLAQVNQGPSSNVESTLINTDPVPLQSGEQGDLRFKIENTGGTDAEDVEVRLLDNYPFQVKQDRKKVYRLGSLETGQEYQISTEVLVAEDAPDGSNDFKLRVISGDLNRTVNVPVEVQSSDIELNLANLQTQPQQLMPDTDNNQVSIDLVNNGDKTAENVVLNLEAPEYFEQTSSFSTRKALGNINPGEKKTSTFVLDLNKTAPAGMAELSTKTSYSASDSTSQVTQTDSFQLNIEGKPQFKVTGVEGGLKTGSTEELRLTVKNRGEEKSSSTRIRVMDSSDQPFSYDSSSQYIGTLEPGQEGEAVFEVETETDAAAKEYLLDFEIRGVKDTEVFVEDTTTPAEVKQSQKSSDIPLPAIAILILAISGAAYLFRNKIRDKVTNQKQ
ncbi:COG1361 S-layer family protein [Candidatus Nanohalobium constans]|uniref:Putative S-layer-like family protein n=1 Tax=Candidatus Nanohalobium constans TaxID=2565781 RepID=A0A5Q0UJ24_9ARCH|nr:NEW3 domain-containing protein [Candidatus Nanohalobium constans]QGA80955.1 putative S-layer-like family protein [Candidatus Nanohalobium constans]